MSRYGSELSVRHLDVNVITLSNPPNPARLDESFYRFFAIYALSCRPAIRCLAALTSAQLKALRFSLLSLGYNAESVLANGGDTDTTEAICGKLARGAFYSKAGIPRRWLDRVCNARKNISSRRSPL